MRTPFVKASGIRSLSTSAEESPDANEVARPAKAGEGGAASPPGGWRNRKTDRLARPISESKGETVEQETTADGEDSI